MLRGQYPHNHDILYNAPPLGGEWKFRNSGRDKSTIATWLNDAGYQTKYIGRYIKGYDGLYKPPGWDEWYVIMGDFFTLSDPTTAKVNDNGQETTLGGNSTDVFADKSSDFIRRSSANPEPFFVMVGTNAPHTPPEVATRHQDQFTTTPLPKPPNFNEADVSDKPAWVRKYPLRTQQDFDIFEKEYRNRLRSMLAVEDLLRKTITTLQETGELNNTYIFFTSDNGFHMGHHRFWMDKKTPYEEDIGVPLMVRGPGVPAGAVRNQLVINNDFAPTIAELAGASTPSFVDGKSFAPLLSSSPPSSWRTAFLEEGYIPPEDGFPVPPHKSVHTQQYMFTEYDTGERELYDLSADPYQLQSISRTANSEQLYSTLGNRLNALRACSGEGCRSAEWATTTTPTDTTRPRVTSTSPAANATGVAPGANFTATFSEAMMASSINGTTFKLFKKGSTTKIGAAVSYDASTRTAKLDPTNNLRLGTTYKAVVTTGAKDLAGLQLDQDQTPSNGLQQKTWLFTVRN
jgi:N-acetylglucosamine-6-sulfatase